MGLDANYQYGQTPLDEEQMEGLQNCTIKSDLGLFLSFAYF